MTRTIYLIDGVSVPKETYNRSRWFENPTASFRMVDVPDKKAERKRLKKQNKV